MRKEFWLNVWRGFLRKGNALVQVLKQPPTWLQVVNFIITPISCAGAIVLAALQTEHVLLDVLSYVAYAVAALSLAYTVYLLIPLFPKIKRRVIAEAEKREFTHTLLRNYSFRTIVFTCGSFCMSIAFAVLNAYRGLVLQSVWFGALGAYYLCLALLRGGVLLFHKHKRQGKHITEENLAHAEARSYRDCGIALFVLNAALSSAIAQMIFDGQTFYYADWTIFAHAAYAFYKITMAIYNAFKAKKQDDLTVQAVRNANLIDAIVSILALQTALLTTFTTDGSVNISTFNTLTGLAVSGFSIGLAVVMIVTGNKQMKKTRLENTTNE